MTLQYGVAEASAGKRGDLDLVKSFRFYIDKITKSIEGLKIMLLDISTIGMVSLAYSQSNMFEQQVFLLDRIENRNRSPLKFLKCICVLRLSNESINELIGELRNPRYAEYYIYFTNIVKPSILERIGEADREALIKDIGEVFCDYYPINPDLFSLQVPHCIGRTLESWDGLQLHRCAEGLLSVCLALHRKPLIRYDKNSKMTFELSSRLQTMLNDEEDLFKGESTPDTPPILLILDRRMDLTTPLLMQWTYQAMVHELFGIQNGRVHLNQESMVPGNCKEFELTSKDDSFFLSRRNANLADLSEAAQQSVRHLEAVKVKTSQKGQPQSLADLRNLIEQLPTFNEKSQNIAKHLALIEEINAIVDKHHLYDVSELEQYLATVDPGNIQDERENLRLLLKLIDMQSLPIFYKIKLFLLFVLCYQNKHFATIRDALRANTPDERELDIVGMFFSYNSLTFKYNHHVKAAGTVLNRAANLLLKGASHVLTQHEPILATIIDQLYRGKLPEQNYPFFGTDFTKEKPQQVILFMVNGATYEEAKVVTLHNVEKPNCRFILGGSTMHNSRSFFEEIRQVSRSTGSLKF